MESKISAPAQYDWADTTLTESTVYSSAQDTITITNALDNMTLSSPYTVTASIGMGAVGAFPNTIYTTSGTNTAPWMTQSSLSAPKIKLDGEGADIEVNGWSLVAAVKSIEQRLAIMQPNPKLESEWEELKQLGDQYRKLEQHIRDKQATWDKLKAMPPPNID